MECKAIRWRCEVILRHQEHGNLTLVTTDARHLNPPTDWLEEWWKFKRMAGGMGEHLTVGYGGMEELMSQRLG